MDPFEFMFSLFGLLLGLSLAEVLHGFSKAVKARARVRIGWLTPLLGMVVMLDLISFWGTAWGLREVLPNLYITLLGMLLFAGSYYLAASLVFPEQPVPGADYDDHYWANKKLVAGAVFALNAPNYAYDLVRSYPFWENHFQAFLTTSIFFGLIAALFFARSARLNLILLILTVGLYLTTAILGLIMRGG